MHGTTYGDLLDSVADAKPLVFVIEKDNYVFGAFINCGLREPDDPTDRNDYDCDLWEFSLAGHFPQPTKIEMAVQGVRWRGGRRVVGDSRTNDVRSCWQYTASDNVPEGYTGVRDDDGDAVLGGSIEFMAEEIEVLRVVQ